MRARGRQEAVDPVAVRIPQAAAMLGIGRSTLYLCIAAGEIEVIKVGRSTLVPVESLNAFVAARLRANARPPARSEAETLPR